MTETPEYIDRLAREYAPEAERFEDADDYQRTLIEGELADRIRERFGATEPVYFLEDWQEDGGCPTCATIDRLLVIECGTWIKEFHANEGLPLPALLDWLDEPRRQAEREAKWAAEKAERERRVAAFDRAVVDPIVDALSRVEEEGYGSDVEWYGKVMTALGLDGREEAA